MQVEIIQKGKVLRTIHHEGTAYVESPKKGKYSLRVRNSGPRRRLAVVSVDGVNVVNGEDAGHDGPGYVLAPFSTVDIPGFRRDGDKVAAFRFKEQGESYAAQTGRGTSNVGVIGLAVFDEKVVQRVAPPPVVIHEHHYPWVVTPVYGKPYPASFTTTTHSSEPIGVYSCAEGAQAPEPVVLGSTSRGGGVKSRCARRRPQKVGNGVLRKETVDVGTAYGEEVTFHTTDTEFERASSSPAVVLSLRYATRQRLESWGVPLNEQPSAPMAPNPFPASRASVPAPPGYPSR
jgi:hypothetical protein